MGQPGHDPIMTSTNRLLASVPTALSYRNVAFSGLLDRLSSRGNLIIASTGAARSRWCNGTDGAAFWELKSIRSGRTHQWYFSSLQHAFFQRYKVNTWN